MKVTICHESTIYIDQQGNYYKLSMGNQYYERYACLGDDITACMRTTPLDRNKVNPKYHITLEGFHVVSCPGITNLHALFFHRKRAAEIVEAEVKSSDYVVACLPGWLGNLGCQYAHKYGKPLFLEIGGCALDAYWNHGIKGKLMAPYFFFKTRQEAKKAPYVLYVTDSFLQNRYPTAGRSIGCSNVSLPVRNGLTLKKRLNKIDQGFGGRIVIGTIGSVDVSYKGHEYIIKALSHMQKLGYSDYEYQMVGRGDTSRLKAIAKKCRVSDKIRFLGTMNHNEIFEWLEQIDIYAQPSRTEGLPRSLIEAMNCGVPAIGSDAGGIPELLPRNVMFKNLGERVYALTDLFIRLREPSFLKELAKENFNKSKEYSKLDLNLKRQNFISEFQDFGKQNQTFSADERRII